MTPSEMHRLKNFVRRQVPLQLASLLMLLVSLK